MLAYVLALAAAEPALWHNQMVGGWMIDSGVHSCTSAAIFEREKTILLEYNHTLNKLILTVLDPSFKSIKTDKVYKLRLGFVKANKMDNSWGEVNAYGVELKDQNGIQLDLKADEALEDIRSSQILGLFRDDVLVASLSLEGSAVMVDALKRCAIDVHRTNPDDPFAGQ